MADQSDDVLTIDDLAIYLKTAKSSLCRLVQEGKVPGQKSGKHWRFRKASIERWLEENNRMDRGEGGNS